MAPLSAYIACGLKRLDRCDAAGKQIDPICIQIKALCIGTWADRLRPADGQQIASRVLGRFGLQFVRRAR